MLSTAEFWKTEAAPPSLPLFNKNLGFALSIEDGAKALETFGQKWAKAFPTAPGTESKDGEVSDVSEAPELGDAGPQVDENEDEHLRIFRRDAERTFKLKLNQDQQISVLSHYVKTYGDYHQGLSFVVSAIMLVADGSTEGKEPLVTKKQLALARRIATALAEDKEKYAMIEAWKAEAVISAVDGYVLMEILKKHRPQLSSQLERNGILPEIWFQRIRCGLCVHVLPLVALFPFLDHFFTYGQPFLRKFTLALLALLETRIAKAGNNTSRILEIIHLDLEVMGLSKAELVDPASAKTKIAEFTDLCLSAVNSAAASCASSSAKTGGSEIAAAHEAASAGESRSNTTTSPSADLVEILSAVDAIDWAVESTRQYDLRLRARMERAKAQAATKEESDEEDEDDEDELSDDSETEEERLARLMGGVTLK
ncbi:hypothetical protein M427DRAFT_71871 [Gonapodya prolifera JEL478]|uniref:Rab-GAP TBC domain-containing protein n=1 Tax=Gonapodya prolifera (strain JEL478) TaxID=1344416 RepID=A0A139A7K0_GONPJ|nr:hypothetical protein M427DRAFT_71871 [Gonapodya prolifera JEL478]|eukprot:KXS12776.1 hypothetical protein M427DRAFT_71871 [Gonapodya prolifera JEL478]